MSDSLHFHFASCVKTHALSLPGAKNLHSAKASFPRFSAPVPVHILHSEGRHSSAKIRSFVDMMAERLRAELSLN